MKGRQSDYTNGAVLRRKSTNGVIVQHIAKARLATTTTVFKGVAGAKGLAILCRRFIDEDREAQGHYNKREEMLAVNFTFNFNSFLDLDCLVKFRFTKRDIIRLLPVFSWPETQTHTRRNRYSVTPILVCCIILRRLATPTRWVDCERMFGKWKSHLSEIFWEGIECLVKERMHLITSSIDKDFMAQNAQKYSDAIFEKSAGLTRMVGFIDGTVLGIARPKGNLSLRVVYNGHKRKHALKFQAVNSPDGLIQHVAGPIEGRRHDWTLYIRSGLEENLPEVLEIDGVRYRIYGDSGYSRRWFMEVPFQGSSLSAAQMAFNTAMAKVRITVEWVFKEVKMYFATLDFKRKLKIYESPIGLLYLSSMLLCNFRNCIYPNQVSKYFNVRPPTLEEYVNHK